MTTALAVMSTETARDLTDQIKVGVEAIWDLIKQAYTERAWSALGYDSWDAYCTSEFGASRLRLPREERSEVVSSLRECGLSVRAIAAATGLGQGTIHRELPSVPNGTVEPVTGVNGKTYIPKPKADPKPKPQPSLLDEAEYLNIIKLGLSGRETKKLSSGGRKLLVQILKLTIKELEKSE